MKLRITGEDADRLGCPREVEYEPDRLMGREAIAIQRQTGYSLQKLGTLLEGTVLLGPDGKPLYETDDQSEPIVDEHGRKTAVREVDTEALLVVVWIACRRAGCQVPYDDFDVNIAGVEWIDSGEPEGKG